jgi:hypothetical protein
MPILFENIDNEKIDSPLAILDATFHLDPPSFVKKIRPLMLPMYAIYGEIIETECGG